jgi:hypothetical protein
MSEIGLEAVLLMTRYGHAHGVLLEADRDPSSVGHHHRVLHRGLLHRKHNWTICNLIDRCLAGFSCRCIG